jgi:predicted DNA-binding protein YlxM (UPF0122 family)
MREIADKKSISTVAVFRNIERGKRNLKKHLIKFSK